MLTGTPFHGRTSRLCQAQNWRRWAGSIVASSYELTHDREYYAIRTAAALIDVSPLYKYHIRGPDAEQFLNRVLTRDVRKCGVNQVMYTVWCDEEGKVLDDGTLTRLAPDSYRLTSADPNLDWLLQNAEGMQTTVEDVSDSLAALALQGPASRRVLAAATDADLDSLRFFRGTSAWLERTRLYITRTGYTGDLGYEIWVDASEAEALWDALMGAGANHGIQPTGILALDVARIEAGLLLIAVDYISAREAFIDSRKSSPFELGLGWTVDLKKGYFVGRRALTEEQNRPPQWRLRGLEVDWESLESLYLEHGLPPAVPTTAWRTSVPVYRRGAQVGYATSGCWSPILKKMVALAHLRSEHAAPGTEVELEVTVEHRRRRARTRVVRTPFYDPERKKA